MDLGQAKEILKTLADGIHPITGEILPEEDSCNQPEVIRALHAVLQTLPDPKPIAAAKQGAKNAGKPWTSEDDAALCRMFDEGSSVREMSQYFGRSRGGIAARLVRLGKIEERKQLQN